MSDRPQIWHVFDVPVPDPEDARRRRLLNILLAVLAFVALLTLIALLIAEPRGLAGEQREVNQLYLTTLLLLLGVAVMYLVNRYVSGMLASTLFTVLLTVIVAISDEPLQVSEGRDLFVFTIPIIAASVLLRPWASFALAGICSLINVWITLGILKVTPNVPAIMGFFVLATVSWLSARSLEQALAKLRAANRELYASRSSLQAYSEQLEEMVTERTRALEEAHQQLVEQEKLAMLGQLAGSMGHELRNPLGVISNAVYYLRVYFGGANLTAEEYLDVVAAEVQRALQIIKDLLDFALTRPAQRLPTALAHVVESVLAHHPAPADVLVDVPSLPDGLLVLVDLAQVAQAVGKIVINAYQAMPDGGCLEIRAERQDHLVALSIADAGCGISPENVSRLFEPLYSTKVHGMGLGLAVARKLIEANEGHIDVQSTPGQGSTFTVYLPASAP